jgi:type IV pilus assembly protein PilW
MPTTRHRQRGFSPVELLISVTLALFLVLSMGSMLVASNRTSRAGDNLTQMQDAGRLALDLIGREIRKSGFRNQRQLAPDQVFTSASSSTPFRSFATAASVSGDASTLSLRYQSSGDNFTLDCLGNAAAANSIVTQHLSVTGGELACAARAGGGSTNTGTLVPYIEGLSVTYGVDTDADLAADSYVAGGSVADWTQVTSINVQVRVVSPDDGIAEAPQPYVGFDGTVTTPTDRRLRRTYSSVIALRNVLP